MLREIGRPERIPEYIARAKDKDDPFRLMGFGHRVYKNFDPRAKVMQKTADEVLEGARHHRSGARRRPRARADRAQATIISSRRSSIPNVDFYSGVILSAIGFPTTMFTALFALARTVGWVAQWNEMISDPEQKIGRPRQLYTGPTAARLRAGGPALKKIGARSIAFYGRSFRFEAARADGPRGAGRRSSVGDRSIVARTAAPVAPVMTPVATEVDGGRLGDRVANSRRSRKRSR